MTPSTNLLNRLLSPLLLLLSHTDGFTLTPPPPHTHLTTTTTSLSLSSTPTPTPPPVSPSSRYYQFEEMEDKESCTTEIYLSPDGTVDVSVTQTDGPLPSSAGGEWTMDDDDEWFEMRVERTFGTGKGMGEDAGSFTVVRVFRGLVEEVGEAVSVSGSMFIPDEITEDIECGFFSMIDTTAERLGRD